MKILEFESKKLLSQNGISVPRQFGLIKSLEDISDYNYPVAAKVQVLQGKRAKRGWIEIVKNSGEFERFAVKCLEKDLNNEKIYGILVEEAIAEGEDMYISLSYVSSGLILAINFSGGVDVEESEKPVKIIPISLLDGSFDLAGLDLGHSRKAGFEEFLKKMVGFFLRNNCELLEINPLRFVDGRHIALDVKMVLDDRCKIDRTSYISAGFQAERAKTERERQMDVVNLNPDFQGSPCRYVELDGDVALLLSGGGASLIIFDEVVARGLKPGNYSEYSGNPNQEKVYELTKIVLSKPGQRGLLIAGGIANFTMIDETMRGIARALDEMSPNYPIVIRRGGPNEEIGREILKNLAKKNDILQITWMSSDKTLREAAQCFAEKVGAGK